MKSGFTLIELSIVLVTVGFLIGGILVAQSMISTSKIIRTVQQVQQFDAAVASFHINYKALPGDSIAFGGNGNGLIEYNNRVRMFRGEIANFWNNINPQAYAYSSPSSPVPDSTEGESKNVPLAELGKKGSFFIAHAFGSNNAGAANPRNFYAILDPSQGKVDYGGGNYGFRQTSIANANSAVQPEAMFDFDQKLDDGKADSGDVISGRVPCGHSAAGTCWGGFSEAVISNNCSSVSTYNVSNKGYDCTPLIRIGAQTGTPW